MHQTKTLLECLWTSLSDTEMFPILRCLVKSRHAHVEHICNFGPCSLSGVDTTIWSSHSVLDPPNLGCLVSGVGPNGWLSNYYVVKFEYEVLDTHQCWCWSWFSGQDLVVEHNAVTGFECVYELWDDYFIHLFLWLSLSLQTSYYFCDLPFLTFLRPPYMLLWACAFDFHEVGLPSVGAFLHQHVISGVARSLPHPSTKTLPPPPSSAHLLITRWAFMSLCEQEVVFTLWDTLGTSTDAWIGFDDTRFVCFHGFYAPLRWMHVNTICI